MSMVKATSRRVSDASGGSAYADPQSRWEAVVARDGYADGQFWFSVATTGIYCYPSCAARTPRRENVRFHDRREDAERAGFRPCKRCRPELPPKHVRRAEAVARACRIIEGAEKEPTLAALAASLQMSPHHFQRCFRELVGVTPKQYALAHRAERLRRELGSAPSVTDAIYDAGYGSASRFYEKSSALLGMRPRAYARGGRGQTIRWGVAESWLGSVLVAATERGICAILFGQNRRELLDDLAARFPHARLEKAETGSDYAAWIERSIALIEAPARSEELPLDVRGTAFQRQVWSALKAIPPGSTATYGEIARRIGKPTAARAVGAACRANPVAIAIPCHRVLARDGSLTGYRWGEERKRALLEKEAAS